MNAENIRIDTVRGCKCTSQRELTPSIAISSDLGICDQSSFVFPTVLVRVPELTVQEKEKALAILSNVQLTTPLTLQ